MDPIYTAEAVVSGAGRNGGHGRTDDGRLEVEFSTPEAFGGSGGDGTNPEQLAAMGYAACFRSALGVVAAREQIALDEATVICRVALSRGEDRDFRLSFDIRAEFPRLSQAEADLLVAEAHQICPYSRAFAHGAPVDVSARGLC